MAAERCILLVEDDDAYRYAVARYLEQAGFSVAPVADSFEALRLIEDKTPVDLLLTDIGIRPVHGFALARMLKCRRPGVKVLYFTGRTDLPENEITSAYGKVLAKSGDGLELVSEVTAAFAS
jgi:DNA-binding response OmpR family regulator